VTALDTREPRPAADLERAARTARIFGEALARRRRKIARGEPVAPPFELALDDELIGGGQ
jgi:hypothetical protein